MVSATTTTSAASPQHHGRRQRSSFATQLEKYMHSGLIQSISFSVDGNFILIFNHKTLGHELSANSLFNALCKELELPADESVRGEGVKGHEMTQYSSMRRQFTAFNFISVSPQTVPEYLIPTERLLEWQAGITAKPPLARVWCHEAFSRGSVDTSKILRQPSGSKRVCNNNRDMVATSYGNGAQDADYSGDEDALDRKSPLGIPYEDALAKMVERRMEASKKQQQQQQQQGLATKRPVQKKQRQTQKQKQSVQMLSSLTSSLAGFTFQVPMPPQSTSANIMQFPIYNTTSCPPPSNPTIDPSLYPALMQQQLGQPSPLALAPLSLPSMPAQTLTSPVQLPLFTTSSQPLPLPLTGSSGLPSLFSGLSQLLPSLLPLPPLPAPTLTEMPTPLTASTSPAWPLFGSMFTSITGTPGLAVPSQAAQIASNASSMHSILDMPSVQPSSMPTPPQLQASLSRTNEEFLALFCSPADHGDVSTP
ncbi:hypothetical protein GQ42DRAFT_2821 [Ramicandelaber brevisporus]|nr:hypothetical protein GQ42DRAFT_2821 [Ramicandelaber brevisporus]